jgi:hypothetical protein
MHLQGPSIHVFCKGEKVYHTVAVSAKHGPGGADRGAKTRVHTQFTVPVIGCGRSDFVLPVIADGATLEACTLAKTSVAKAIMVSGAHAFFPCRKTTRHCSVARCLPHRSHMSEHGVCAILFRCVTQPCNMQQ